MKKWAVCESERLQRNPNGVGQIDGSFHHDGRVGSAGDVEPELIALHTKVGAAGLDQRVPQHGWNAGKRGTPAGGAR